MTEAQKRAAARAWEALKRRTDKQGFVIPPTAEDVQRAIGEAVLAA